MKALWITFFLFSGAVPLVAQTFTETTRLRINTRDFSEFAPVIANGKFYFCSNRKTSLTANTSDGTKTIYYHNVFEVKDTSLFRAEIMPEPLNTIANDGPLCFGADGSLYISRNFAFGEKSKKEARVGIFTHTMKDGKWSEKNPFEYNSTEYSTGHPWVSEDGMFLFFSSDRPGGYGGFDIYFCRYDNGKWAAPLNAGSGINSPRNEIFPFLHSSGQFYFSSDADSASGYNIYTSFFTNGQFGSPQKLDSPVNSEKNDFSFWCDASTENGFFASDRNGSDDIYRFRSTFPSFETCDSMKENNYCYTFFEENRYEIDTTLMAYEWDFGDKKIRSEEADYCFPGPGAYEVSLNIIDVATGDVYQKQASYMMEIKEVIQPVIDLPEDIPAFSAVDFSAARSNLPGFEVLGYYWRFSDGTKLSGQTVSHSIPSAGDQTVWLGVILKDIENNTTVKKCVFRKFEVMPAR